MKGNATPSGGLPIPEGMADPMAQYVKKATGGGPVGPASPSSFNVTSVPLNSAGSGSGVLVNPEKQSAVQLPQNASTQVRIRSAPDPNMGWSDVVNQISALKTLQQNGGLNPDQDIYLSNLHDLARQKLQGLQPQVQRLENGGITGPSDAQSYQNMKQARDALQQAVQVRPVAQVMARTAQANINAGSDTYNVNPLAVAGPDAKNFTPEAMMVQAGKTTDPKKQAALLNKAASMQAGNAAQAQQDMNDPMRTGTLSDIAESINAPIKRGIMAATVPGPLKGTAYDQVAEAVADNILGAINPASVASFIGGAIQNPGGTLSAIDEQAQKALFLKKSDSLKDYASSVIQTAMLAHGLNHGVASLSDLASDSRIAAKLAQETGVSVPKAQEAINGAIGDISKTSATEIPPATSSERTVPPIVEPSKSPDINPPLIGEFNALRTNGGKLHFTDETHDALIKELGLTPDQIESTGTIKGATYVPRETPIQPTVEPTVAQDHPAPQGTRVGETWRNPDTGTTYEITAQQGDKLSVSVTHDGKVENPVRVTDKAFDSRVNAEQGFEPVKPQPNPDAINGLSNFAQERQIAAGQFTQPEKLAPIDHEAAINAAKGTTIPQGEELAKEIAKQNRPFSAAEHAVLLQAGREFEIQANAAVDARDAAIKSGDAGQIEKAQTEYEKIRDRHQEFVDNVQKGKGAWSQTGNALQRGLALDEGNPAMVRAEAVRAKNKVNQGPKLSLTPEEEAKVLQGSKAYKEAVARAEAAENEAMRLKAESTARLETKAARSPRTQVKIEAIRGERQAAIDALKKLPLEALSRASANPLDIPIEAARQLGIIAKTFAQEGVANLEELVNKVNAHLKENGIPEQSDRTIYRALAGHGLEEVRTPSEATLKLNQLKAHADLIERINRLMEGNPYKKPTAKGPVSDSVEGLRKAYADLKKQSGVDAPDPVKRLQGSIDKALTVLEHGKDESLPNPTDTPEVAAMRKRLADIRGKISEKYATPVEQAKIDALAKKIADANDVLAKGKPTPKPGEVGPPTENVDKLTKELADVKRSIADKYQTPAEEAKLNSINKRIQNAESKLENGPKPAKVTPEGPPTAQIDAAQKALDAKLKEVSDKYATPEEKAKVDSLQKRITNAKDRLENGPTVKPTKEGPPTEDVAKLQKELKKVQDQIKAKAKPNESQVIDNLRKKQADLEDQLATGRRPAKTPKPETPDSIKKVKQDLNDAASRVRLTDRMAALQDQIDTKTFPEKKMPREGPPDVQKLRADVKQRALEAQQLRDEIQRKAEFDQKTNLQKAGVYAAQTFQGLSRNLKLAIHASAPFMQGRKVLFVDPKAWLQSWGPMIHGYMSGDAAANAQLARFHADPLWDKAHASGISEVLAQPHGSLTQMEESIRADLSDRIPYLNKVFSHSGAAFNGFLNEARWQMFKHASEISQDPKYLAAMAREIGTMTGRSTSKLSKQVAPAGAFIFSPRYTVSKWEYATGKPLRGTDSIQARNQIAQNYGKVALGYTVAGLAAAQFFGGKLDLNPKSSNFGRLNIGKNDIDLFTQEGEPIKLVAQSLMGSISAAGNAAKANPAQTLGRYGENKLLPALRLPLDLAQGNFDEEGHHTVGAFDKAGPKQHPYDWGQQLKDLISPISVQGPIDEYKKGANLAPLSFLGIGTRAHTAPSPTRRK